jgi:hypothetical protein
VIFVGTSQVSQEKKVKKVEGLTKKRNSRPSRGDCNTFHKAHKILHFVRHPRNTLEEMG